MVRRISTVFRHPYRLKGTVNPLPDNGRRQTKVFRPECHVILDYGGYKLVIWVLKDHADLAAHFPKPPLVGSIDPIYQYSPLMGH
jgi:hypothetical protein